MKSYKTQLITVRLAAQHPGGWYLLFLGKWYPIVSVVPTSVNDDYEVRFLLNKRVVIYDAKGYEPVLAVPMSLYKRYE